MTTIGLNLLYLVPGKVGGTEVYARRLEAEYVQRRCQLQPAARDIRLRAHLYLDRSAVTDHLRGLFDRHAIDLDATALDQVPRLRTRWRKRALDERPVQTQLVQTQLVQTLLIPRNVAHRPM